MPNNNFKFFILFFTILIQLSKSDFNQLPIRITEQPESQVASKGAKVTFKCEYALNEQSAATKLKINWLFNSNLDDQVNRLLDHEADFIFDKNRLTILSFDPLVHTGQYRCLINNTLNQLAVLSEPANLTLAKIDSFESSQSDQTQINLSEGNVAIITCKLPNSNPPAIPIFYFNDQLLPASYISVNSQLDSNRYKIFPSGNLQISNVKHTDSGTYKCSARNSVTNEIKNSSKRTVLKVYEPFGTKLPEIVYVPIDTNRVQIGSNLTLECVANGAPVPLVSWEKFGGILPDKRSMQIFGNLVLTNVQPEDKGTYVCRAENGPGQATFKTAMIDVFEAPTLIPNSEIRYSSRKGESIDLKCPIRSRPRADIQWFFQGKLLTATGAFHRISSVGDKSILTIRNFQPAQSSGIYQCFAQNEYGSQQVDLFLSQFEADFLLAPKQRQFLGSNENSLNVQEVPKRPVIIMGPQNTTIYEGQSVVLLCVTSETSSGNAQINWLQNDLIIEPTLMRRFEINQLLGNLRIVSVQKSDAGIYKCIASNEFGMSTAEAYVHVKSSSSKNQEDDSKLNRKINPKNDDTNKKLVQLNPMSSRPSIQQIGADKILLKWNLIDSQSNLLDSNANFNIAYFKVDYKTNKQQIPGIQPHTWLTIDEQIDPKKREYILTDLSKFEIYRFRITTFFLNGELNHSHQSAKFKLEPTWSPFVQQTTSSAPLLTTSSTTDLTSKTTNFKLSQIQVQITQIWAISSSSLGLKWDVLTPLNQKENKTNFLLQKINGFYIYYRKLNNNNQAQSNQNDQALFDQNAPAVPLYNYTRINVPISIVDTAQLHQFQQMIDTYIIANLEQSTQYEIKMTCYNLNGDLCSFSNTIYGLTLVTSTTYQSTLQSQTFLSTKMGSQSTANNNQNSSVVFLKSKQNEILFMILGVVLGVLTLLLIIFIVMCLIRQRQHRKLLAQLHNTSHKLTSSSCPTLIYEDSLRQNNRLNSNHANLNSNQLNYTGNLFIPGNNTTSTCTNDSNSTNSQSMSTTTSSMTTPPALVSAQTNADNSNIQPSHILFLNGNTVSTASIGLGNGGMPPPIPQVPPPSMLTNATNQPTATLNRININMNPLNGYLETNLRTAALSPNKTSTINTQAYLNNNQSENFYHTLTQLGTLPNQMDQNEATQTHYSDYNNATLNMRHLLLKQQHQQQQFIMNTLKNINLKQQLASQQYQLNTQLNTDNEGIKKDSVRSPSIRRNGSVNSSKKSKKGIKHQNENNQINEQISLQAQPQTQQTNYYLLPNCLPQQALINRNIYNEVDLLTIEAAILNQNIANGNIYLLNQQPNQLQAYPTQISSFMPSQQLLSPANNLVQIQTPNNLMDLFDRNDQNEQQLQQQKNEIGKKETISGIYEPSEMDNQSNEQEPMLANHYATSGLLLKEKNNKSEVDENNQLL